MTNELAPSEFISKIVQDADTGWSFVPLVGSGLSSPSGIIMGMEFTNYLAFSSYLVLSNPTERDKTHGESKSQRWNLAENGWPPLPTREEVGFAREWILKEFKTLCDRSGLDPSYDESTGVKYIKSLQMLDSDSSPLELLPILARPKIPSVLASHQAAPANDRARRFVDLIANSASLKPYPGAFAVNELVSDPFRSYHQRVVEMGIRALHDWRETLVFLASTKVDRSTGRLQFSEMCDTSIIDDFNSTITRDKRPNLGHKMLAHLSSPLRIQTILTTNFDTLLEDAFRALALSIRVLPVSTKGRLPQAKTVAADDSIVKLHGEAHDTRADLSLDEEPSTEDLATFANYLTCGGGYSNETYSVESKRLIVAGYSGSDIRCVQMIKHWLESSQDGPVVYWICFSESDLLKVQKLFDAPEYSGRIRLTQCARPDLLLYELYQRICLSLPPGGLTYEFSHIVPPQQLHDFDSPMRQITSVLKCTSESNYLFESSRVIVGNAGSLRQTRNLARDAVVKSLAQVIIDALSGKSVPLSNDDNKPVGYECLHHIIDWQPWYRQDSSDPEQTYSNPAFVTPLIIDSVGSVVRACALAVNERSKKFGTHVFWIETQDYVDVDGIIRDFLRGIALRFGQFQSHHVTQHPFDYSIASAFNKTEEAEAIWSGRAIRLAAHIKQILLEYRVDPQALCVLLYGRDSFGACAGVIPAIWKQEDKRQFEALHCFIEGLAISGIRVIYFPLLKDRAEMKSLRGRTKACQVHPVTGQTSKPSATQQQCAEENADNDWPFDQIVSDAEEVKNCRRIERSYSIFTDTLTSVLGDYFQVVRKENGFDVIPNATVEDPSRTQHLTFLYAITLFRHSRHPNALCSEATFQCPFRLNTNAIDNDYVRSKESAEWISQLRESRIFFDKPGGSVWMHRDIRIALRSILESVVLCKGKKRRCNRGFIEMRARLHFWIGDWYFKAFCSSGHLTPVVEAVHHRVMAAIYSHSALPKYKAVPTTKNRVNYQESLFVSSLLEAGKTLLTALPELKLWQACALEASWLGAKHRDLVRSSLASTIESICESLEEKEAADNLRKKLTSQSDRFIKTMELTCVALTLEGGGGSREAKRFDESSLGVADTEEATKAHAELTMKHGWEAIDVTCSTLRDNISEVFSNDVLGTGAKNLYDLIAPQNSKAIKYGTDEIEMFGVSKATWKHDHGGQVDKVCNLVWLLGETSYVYLRHAKLQFHAMSKIAFPQWLKATAICNLGIDLCKHIPPEHRRFDTESRIKLHTLYSVALANLGRFFEANRHLNEAQALLSKSDIACPSNYAVLCLRRAEVRLTECYWIATFLMEDVKLLSGGRLTSERFSTSFGSDELFMLDGDSAQIGWSVAGVSQILDSKKASNAESQGEHQTDWTNVVLVPPRISECIRKAGTPRLKGETEGNETFLTYGDNKWQHEVEKNLLRLYSGTIDEAVSLLDQAEKGLGGHSQSSLWWCRLHTLKLRVFGLLEPLGKRAFDSLILRKHPADMGIHENFVNALRIASSDHFRKLRVVKYFFEANRWYWKVSGSADERTKKTLLPDTYKLASKAKKELIAFANQRKQDDPTSSLAEAILLMSRDEERFTGD